MKKILYGILVFFMQLTVASDLPANDFSGTYGMSAKGVGMGNAVSALVDDWSSVFYNISGLGKTPGRSVSGDVSKRGSSLSLKSGKVASSHGSEKKTHLNEVSVSFLYSYPVFDININRPDVKGDEGLDAKIAMIGAVIDMNTFIKVPSWLISTARIGIGAGVPVEAATKINDLDQRTHNYLAYGREAEQAVVLGGFGLGFLDDMFGVGLGINAAFGGEGFMTMHDLKIGSGEQNPSAQASIDLKTTPSFVAGLYLKPEKIYRTFIGKDSISRIIRGLDIGFSYRQEKVTDIEGIPAEAVTQVGDVTMNMIISATESYTPHSFDLGLAYTYDRYTVSADFEYQMWSGYKISSGAQKVFAGYAAANADENEDGQGDGYLYVIPDFKDIFIFRIGARMELFDWITIMTGYVYQPSFVPVDKINNTRFNYLDCTKHILSLGCTVHLPEYSLTGGPVDITCAFQTQILEERNITKSIPTTEDPNYSYGGWCPSVMIEASMKI